MIHFIIDEAASCGHFTAIEDALNQFRGYGVRLLLIYQSIGQLRKCFPEGQDQTLLSNVSQVFFGVNDNATAEYVSTRLGEETILLESGSRSRGTTRQWTDGPHPHSSSYSDNTTSNWQQQARKLQKLEEIIALPPRTAITFTPGVPPIHTTLLRYYEEKNLGRTDTWFRRSAAAVAMLARAAILCAASLGIAWIATLLAAPALISAQRPASPVIQERSQTGRELRPDGPARSRPRVSRER
jgi:type IV secretion system protein VirD4